MSWHSRQGVKQNFKNCQTWSARVPRTLAMSFPSNKREASQKLNPFHGQRLAQRGHNQHQTLLSSSCLPLPADLNQPGLCRQKPAGELLFLVISSLQGWDAASFLYGHFRPVLASKCQGTQFNLIRGTWWITGAVKKQRGHLWQIPRALCGRG